MTRPHPSPGQPSLLRNLGQMVGHVVQAVAQPAPGAAAAGVAADEPAPERPATDRPVVVEAELVEISDGACVRVEQELCAARTASGETVLIRRQRVERVEILPPGASASPRLPTSPPSIPSIAPPPPSAPSPGARP
jgi:hypothetical protein